MSWIDINEEMPEKKDWVLLVVNNEVLVGHCWPGKEPMFYDQFKMMPIWEGITHWQYLPDPPIEDIYQTSFHYLVGLQRDIIVLMCREFMKSDSLITERITQDDRKYFAASLNCSSDSVKNSIQRLIKKGCLECYQFKNGRGGWARYKIPDHIYADYRKYMITNRLLMREHSVSRNKTVNA